MGWCNGLRFSLACRTLLLRSVDDLVLLGLRGGLHLLPAVEDEHAHRGADDENSGEHTDHNGRSLGGLRHAGILRARSARGAEKDVTHSRRTDEKELGDGDKDVNKQHEQSSTK